MSITSPGSRSAVLTLFLASSVIALSAFAAQGQTCTPPKIDPKQSLVVTDGALDRSKFSFSNTVDAILGSVGVAKTPANRENFLKSLITSFNAAELVNPDSGLRMPMDVRPLEAALDPKKLLDPSDPMGLVPTALFNRLDLAPADWSNCGEHRIIYSFKAAIPAPSGPPSRFFLIFEGRLDSVSPESGFEGCRAVAKFWRDLSDVPDPKKRAERLEELFYKGFPGTEGPVIQAKNYGGPRGQVRGNIFVNTRHCPKVGTSRMDCGQLGSGNTSVPIGDGQGQSDGRILPRHKQSRFS